MSRITTCPHCSTRLRVAEQITDKTLICPHCFADVDNAGAGNQLRAADINTDVKRDLNVGCIVLLVLMGLCVLGVAIGFSIPDRPGDKRFSLLDFSSLALVILVGITIIWGLVRTGISGVQAPSSGGKIAGILFLVLGTIAAIVLFVFFACAVAISNMQIGR